MEQIIHTARFISSNPSLRGCPPPDFPEFAFIGRSNVGKSSLINMLTQHKGLAKISSTPGKTRLINHFLINNQWYLVDLPGYGYARLSKEKRQAFKKLIWDYIGKRDSLYYLFVLIDSRIPPQAIDLDFINLLGTNEIAFGIIFTKTDKISQSELDLNLRQFSDALSKTWDELPPVILTSALTQKGRDEILQTIFSALERQQADL